MLQLRHVMERLKNAWSATGHGLRRVFWHKWLLIAAIAVLVALGGVAAAAYGYDRSQSDMIAKGVHVGGIPIGGMTADAGAREAEARSSRRCPRPIILTYKGGRLVLTAKQAQVRVDVDALVDQALAQSHKGWFVSRAWRELTGGRVEAGLRPHVTYSKAAVNQTLVRIENRVEREPANAWIKANYNGLAIHGGKNGVEVKLALLRWQIRHSLLSRHARRWYKVPLRAVTPEVTIPTLKKDYPSYITIDRGDLHAARVPEPQARQELPDRGRAAGPGDPGGHLRGAGQAGQPLVARPQQRLGRLPGRPGHPARPVRPAEGTLARDLQRGRHPRDRRHRIAGERRFARLRAHGDP